MQRLLNTLAIALAVIGAVNWGLVGSLRFNLVSKIFGVSTRAEKAVYLAVGIAGLWLGIAFALPRALISLGVRGQKPSAVWTGQPITGKVMPVINGKTLDGKAISIPGDTKGKLALLAMGFAYEARFDVADWVELARERFGQEPDVLLYEMPMVGGIYRLFEPIIQAGMRQGTPAEMFGDVITVYGSHEALRQAIGALPSTDTWIYLLDQDGTVLFQHGGPFDRQRFNELSSIMEIALKGVSAEERKAA
jgi:uncharacterized protein